MWCSNKNDTVTIFSSPNLMFWNHSKEVAQDGDGWHTGETHHEKKSEQVVCCRKEYKESYESCTICRNKTRKGDFGLYKIYIIGRASHSLSATQYCQHDAHSWMSTLTEEMSASAADIMYHSICMRAYLWITEDALKSGQPKTVKLLLMIFRSYWKAVIAYKRIWALMCVHLWKLNANPLIMWLTSRWSICRFSIQELSNVFFATSFIDIETFSLPVPLLVKSPS